MNKCRYEKDYRCTKDGCVFKGSTIRQYDPDLDSELVSCVFCSHNTVENQTDEDEQMKEFGTEPADIKIEGIGKDAPTVENESGGKQSASPAAMHLIDPYFLERFISRQLFTGTEEVNKIYEMIRHIAFFMNSRDFTELYKAIEKAPIKTHPLLAIAKVLKEGADKYEPNNWRLIPEEEHINHALIHLLAAALGDKQDNHLEHALCRLMMSAAANPSEYFSYTKYIKKQAD